MAVSRLSQQSLQNAFPKGNTIWDGTTATSAFDSLGSVLLSASASSITFSNIPQTYTHLHIRVLARSTGTGPDQLALTFNGSSSSYTDHNLRHNNNVTGAGYDANGPATYIDRFPGTNATTGNFGPIVMDILDYTATTKAKVIRALGGYDSNGSTSLVALNSGSWYANTAGVYQAITSITITNTFAAYSQVSLYGVK